MTIVETKRSFWTVGAIAFVVVLLSAMLCPSAFAGKAEDRAAKKAVENAKETDTSPAADSSLGYIKGRQLYLDGKFEEAAPFLEQALKGEPENPLINHQLGEIYLRLGQFDRAETFAKKAVEKEPKNIEYRATLGGVFASSKRYPEAKEQYRAILDLEPENLKAPLLLGILEAESGELDRGIKTLTKAIEANPDNVMAYFYRAKIYYEADDVKHAKQDFDKCLTLRPSFSEAGQALGMIHEKLGEIDDAIKVYNRIQGGGRFKKRLAQLYLQKNDFEKALAELAEYEKVEPDDYTARVKIGLIYFELKKFDKAAERFQQILKEQPEADNVRFYLGAVYEEMKRSDLAIVEFKKVSKESAFFRESVLHLGFLYREQNRIKDGIELARKLNDQNPDVVEFYDMHASFYEIQKDYKKALEIVQAGIKRHPTDEKLLYFEGALLDRLGNRKLAIENMRKILKGNENSPHALNFLGYTFAEMGENLDEAEQLVRKALTLRPNDGFIEDSLGWVLFKKGKVDDALSHLERALKVQPEEAVIYEHLGDLYKSRNESAKALEMYRKGIGFSKKDKEMNKKLEAKVAGLQKDGRMPTGDDEEKKSEKN